MANAITIATCQFPVSANLERNLAFILRLVDEAGRRGADVAHFSESSLGGYAGIDFPAIDRGQAPLLMQAVKRVAARAAASALHVILGSHHFTEEGARPFNCLWLIDDRGAIAGRYDKRFLYGPPGDGEYAHYRPGRAPLTFVLKGIRCGLLICHEWRYPELYREQVRLGTRLLFQSWYDGALSARDYEDRGRETGSLITGTVRGSAANNHLWISASNTSRRESCFPSFVVRPDGRIVRRLKRNVTGVLITRLDDAERVEDPSGPWRQRAMQGILHGGGPESV